VTFLGLIFNDECLGLEFSTKPGFVSIRVSCLYVYYTLQDYFSNLFFLYFFSSNYNGN